MSSFTTRVAGLFAALVIATTAVVLVVGGWLLSHQTIKGLDLLNEAEFAELHSRLGPEPVGLSAQEVDRRIRSHAEVDASMFFFQVRSLDGRILFRSANLGQLDLPASYRADGSSTAELRGVGKVRVSTRTQGELVVQIASPLQPALQLMGSYTKTSAFLLAGVAVASVGLGWYFSWLIMRPVRAIRTTAAQIRGDNLSQRIPVPAGRDELVALVGLLNQMFDRLERSFSEVKRFTADASHELKTPLALARLSVEKLRPAMSEKPGAVELIDDALEDLDRLKQIIESLLFLAKIDSGTFSPAFKSIDAEAFIRDFAADATALAEDRGAAFVLGRVDAGEVCCEATLLRQVLLNLISNSLRVVARGGCVQLDSELQETHWRLVVTDDGPGLPTSQLGRVFERFVRHEPTAGTAQDQSGHGLGLAICRSIAQLHGGEIRAENRPDRSGLRVIFNCPRHTSANRP